MPSIKDPFSGSSGGCLDFFGSTPGLGVVILATEQWSFIIKVVLNILDNIHDMVATVSTLWFGDTRVFPSCSFVMRHSSAFLVCL